MAVWLRVNRLCLNPSKSQFMRCVTVTVLHPQLLISEQFQDGSEKFPFLSNI